MKKLIQFVLLLAIIGLAYILYRQFARPLEFEAIRKEREAEVVNRLRDIRAAQRAHRQAYQRFSPNMDSLIYFIKYDSMTYERQIGSLDDSVAMAQGRVRRETFRMAVRDTIFSGRNLTDAQIEEFRIIPNSNNENFIMAAGTLETGSGVVVQVFEARAPYRAFLNIDGFDQELINLIDERRSLGKYPGLKVGSLTEATNEAGNWE